MYNSGKTTNIYFFKLHFVELFSVGHKEAKLTSISLADHSSSSRADIDVVQLDSGGKGSGSCFLWPRMRTVRFPWQRGKLASLRVFHSSSDLTNRLRKHISDGEVHLHVQKLKNTGGLACEQTQGHLHLLILNRPCALFSGHP